MHGRSIVLKELLPIILAVIVWGRGWQGCMVRCKCDNAVVVHVVGSRYSRCSDIMHLLRCLFLVEVYYQLYVTAVHVPGVENSMADNLSRNRLSAFLLQAPDMPTQPVPLPLMAPDLLLDPTMDWCSPTWIALFKSIVP